jgi:hypothetical protein
MTSMRALIVGVALGLVTLLVGLGLAASWSSPAASVRLEGDDLIVYDPEIGFVPPPSSRTRRTYLGPDGRPQLVYHLFTDERGARITHAGAKTAERTEIVTIGCSFTWGHGMENEDTFAARLSTSLGAPVANFAMGSYGTVQSWQMLHRHRDLEPKLAIYGFVTDHLRRNVVPCAPSYDPFCLDYAHVVWGRDGRPAIAPPASDGVRRARLQGQARLRWLDPVTWTLHGLDVAYGRLSLIRGRALETDVAKQEAALEFLLERMAGTADAMGAKLLVVHIPTANAPPPAVLSRAVARLDLPFLDLTAAFARDHPNPATSPFYIPDGHPSAAAHALIAAEIVAFVRRERLWPLDTAPKR